MAILVLSTLRACVCVPCDLCTIFEVRKRYRKRYRDNKKRRCTKDDKRWHALALTNKLKCSPKNIESKTIYQFRLCQRQSSQRQSYLERPWELLHCFLESISSTHAIWHTCNLTTRFGKKMPVMSCDEPHSRRFTKYALEALRLQFQLTTLQHSPALIS